MCAEGTLTAGLGADRQVWTLPVRDLWRAETEIFEGEANEPDATTSLRPQPSVADMGDPSEDDSVMSARKDKHVAMPHDDLEGVLG